VCGCSTGTRMGVTLFASSDEAEIVEFSRVAICSSVIGTLAHAAF
jgi:hypothetical protein